MSSIGTGYDLSVTTFSPDGRVFQIEYAAKAVDKSGTVIAIKCKDGIVMGVEKLIYSKMMLGGSNWRIHSVHRHSCMRYFGAAIGKGKQAAKTEIEKLKLSELTCRQGVIEVAKIIYGVHDEAKDKEFELELCWVCDESNKQHQKVPEQLLQEAKAAAVAALEEMDAD